MTGHLLFVVLMYDFLSRLCYVRQRDASCDYSLGPEPNSLSPRSDEYSLTDILEKETCVSPRTPTFAITTETTVGNPVVSTPVTHVKTTSGQTGGPSHDTGSSASTFLTSVKPAVAAAGSLTSAHTTLMSPESGDEIAEEMISMIGAAVTVGVLFVGLALLFAQSRIEKCGSKR
ncbi:uncharacterized protein LOC143328110 [Chaetodon auriga]|uniref:uncharacterized protein LOC143328110 n=1 Tax=Chaetodon auriga TaxID=39042 RepID=UPI00403300A4